MQREVEVEVAIVGRTAYVCLLCICVYTWQRVQGKDLHHRKQTRNSWTQRNRILSIQFNSIQVAISVLLLLVVIAAIFFLSLLLIQIVVVLLLSFVFLRAEFFTRCKTVQKSCQISLSLRENRETKRVLCLSISSLLKLYIQVMFHLPLPPPQISCNFHSSLAYETSKYLMLLPLG